MIQFPTLSVMQKNRAAVAAELRRLLPKMEGFRTAKPLPIGVSAIDSHLPDGGLHGGALHEIVPEDGGAPAAVGFMVALLARLYSPPQPNSGVPEFGQYQSDRSRKHPTSIGEGLGVGVVPPQPIVEEGEDLPARTSRPDPPPYPPPQGGREKKDHPCSVRLRRRPIRPTLRAWLERPRPRSGPRHPGRDGAAQ